MRLFSVFDFFSELYLYEWFSKRIRFHMNWMDILPLKKFYLHFGHDNLKNKIYNSFDKIIRIT